MGSLEIGDLTATEESFSASMDGEALWARLLPGEVEGYRYHLAFEQGGIEGFRTGYIVVRHGVTAICLAPYFITDYRLDSTVQGPLKRVTRWIRRHLPNLLTLRLLCVGSPVTDSGKLGFLPSHRFHPEALRKLCTEMERIAIREGATLLAFKDILERDARQLDAPLHQAGFAKLVNMPVATNAIGFSNLDDYLASLSRSTRKDLRRKYRQYNQVSIEECNGLPENIDEVYRLYLNCYQKSELQFEKLTPEFFRSVATLMPGECRFVLYRAEGKLIGFNLLLHKNGVLLDKYLGLDYHLSRKHNLYYLSWLHNLTMCLHDGFHTYQSGQAAYRTKLKLGATLEQTYLYFRHRNHLVNPLLQLASRFFAYENFDKSLTHER